MMRSTFISSFACSLLLLFSQSNLVVASERRPSSNIPRSSFRLPPPPDIKFENYRFDGGSNETDPRENHALNRFSIEQPTKPTESDKPENASDAKFAHQSIQILESNDKNEGSFYRFDELDLRILRIALPLMTTFAINPVVAAFNLFWVNQLGDALAVSGQSAANQMFGSMFMLFSFLPSVTATLVSKNFAKGDFEGTQNAVCQALTLGFFISALGSSILFFNPSRVLRSIMTGKQTPERVYPSTSF